MLCLSCLHTYKAAQLLYMNLHILNKEYSLDFHGDVKT